MVGVDQSLMSCDPAGPGFSPAVAQGCSVACHEILSTGQVTNIAVTSSERIREERGWPQMEAPVLSLPNLEVTSLLLCSTYLKYQ